MKSVFIVTIGVIIAFFLIGCPLPHSRLYKPVSDWERDAFSKADRDIFPDDIRKDFDRYDSARVAWPGIVITAEWNLGEDEIAVQFTIEHHYYSWIEDFSIQQEHIFLSPRGEGIFQTTWLLKPDSDTAKITESVGDMIIVYGVPLSVEDTLIVLRACSGSAEVGHGWSFC